MSNHAEPIPSYRPKIKPYIRPYKGEYSLTYAAPNGTLHKMILDADGLGSIGLDVYRITLVEHSEWVAQKLAEKRRAEPESG